jgi:hypothetical protein
MTLFDDLNNFRGAFLTKTVIDRKTKITTGKDDTEVYGPQWPEVIFSLNHINHARYLDGQGPHLFKLTFGMVHKASGFDGLMGESMVVASVTITVPTTPSSSTPPVVKIAMEAGNVITFSCGSVAISSKSR